MAVQRSRAELQSRALKWALAPAALLVALGADAEPFSRGQRVEYTARTLNAGELTLGPTKVHAGLLDTILVGTYVPTWFTWPVLGAPIPTAFIKVRDPFAARLAVSLRATLVYLSTRALSGITDDSSTEGALLIVPVEGALTFRFSRRFAQSTELTYVAGGLTRNTASTTTLEGSAVSSNVTFSTFSELQLTDAFALTWLNRVLLYQGGTRIRARATQGATSIDADIEIRNRQALTACAVPGVQLTFGAFNFDVGLGYGSWWLPIIQLPLPYYGLVPEANAYVRF